MDAKVLFEAILGNRPDLFEQIWPVYKQFLEESNAAKRIEKYFLDRQALINDFFAWLGKTGHMETLQLIDRRAGGDRRGDVRPDAPGRRKADQDRAQAFRSSLATPPSGFIRSGDDLSKE